MRQKHTLGPITAAASARLWSKVDRSAGPIACWPFVGARFAYGYGMLYLDGRVVGAHRVALSDTLGRALGPEEWALHSCDNPPCCNPSHLRIGTPAENVRDGIDRARMLVGDRNWTRQPGAITRPPRLTGEANPAARLTETSVRTIRERHGLGESAAALGRAFGVRTQTVDALIKRRTWRHV